MQTVHTIADLRLAVAAAKRAEKKVAFVPTMGNLHEGHLSLIDCAKQHAGFIVSSIFVNPMQFGKNEDLDSYPRTLKADAEGLEESGCDLLFAPSVNEVYPDGLTEETRVEVPAISDRHCGASRPGHFTGVATVVSKLFNMVQPDVAIFGEKDFQQLAVIRKMVRDLCFPIEIIGKETSREANGLARSSRNGYLSEAEKNVAKTIYQVMIDCKDQLNKGERNFDTLQANASKVLEDAGFKIDYVNFANPSTLEVSGPEDTDCVILIAAWLGATRLIDNIQIKLDA